MRLDPDRRRISPKELKAKGWEPMGGRTYRHHTGWLIEHCGHPTALWPYALYSPGGRLILTGAREGKPECGRAWPTVASAVDYVAAQSH